VIAVAQRGDRLGDRPGHLHLREPDVRRDLALHEVLFKAQPQDPRVTLG